MERYQALANSPMFENRPSIETSKLLKDELLFHASGLANGQPFPSLGSRAKPVPNADGSTDIYLSPKAPDGKASNWLATVPGKEYFAILRLYSPTEPAIHKSWKPGDIAKKSTEHTAFRRSHD
jgi:hypothetical protein